MSKEIPEDITDDVVDEKENMNDEESTTDNDDEMLYVYEAFIAEQGY